MIVVKKSCSHHLWKFSHNIACYSTKDQWYRIKQMFMIGTIVFLFHNSTPSTDSNQLVKTSKAKIDVGTRTQS